jgi:hypothetical protein
MEKKNFLVPFVNIVNVNNEDEIMLRRLQMYKITSENADSYFVQIPDDPECAIMMKADEENIFFVLE